MTVGILVSLIVPINVVILMTAVGLNLRLGSVQDVLRHPRSLLVSTIFQLTLLPTAALILIWLLEPPGLIALVILAIAISPGGALSNSFTHLIGGNLALSILMTTLTTILVSASAPLVLAVAFAFGLLDTKVVARLDPLTIAWDLVRLALMPILAGFLCSIFLPGLASRLRRAMNVLSMLAIAIVLAMSVIVSLPVIQQAAAATLVYAAAFSLTSLGIGAAVGRLLPVEDRSACFIEFGGRNLPIALVLSSGSTASEEIVAFLLGYFIVNTTIVFGLTLLKEKPSNRIV
jgi:bile acid:Na+ symporter, BASS family